MVLLPPQGLQLQAVDEELEATLIVERGAGKKVSIEHELEPLPEDREIRRRVPPDREAGLELRPVVQSAAPAGLGAVMRVRAHRRREKAQPGKARKASKLFDTILSV